MAISKGPKRDNSWEKHGIGEVTMNSSGTDSISENITSPEQEDKPENDEEYKVQGAEPSHFEPIVPPERQRDLDWATAGERDGV